MTMTSNNSEPFGKVTLRQRNVPKSNNDFLSNNGNPKEASLTSSSYHINDGVRKHGIFKARESPGKRQKFKIKTRYKYNLQTSFILIPSLILLFTFNTNSCIPLATLSYATLILYCVDLGNWKDGLQTGIWISFFIVAISYILDYCFVWKDQNEIQIDANAMYHYHHHEHEHTNAFMSISTSYTTGNLKMLFETYWKQFHTIKDYHDNNYNENYYNHDSTTSSYDSLSFTQSISLNIFTWLGMGNDITILFCLACWATLQCQWIPIDDIEYATFLQQKLHLVLPIASSIIVTISFIKYSIMEQIIKLFELEHELHINNHNNFNHNDDGTQVERSGGENWIWNLAPFLCTLVMNFGIQKLLCHRKCSFLYFSRLSSSLSSSSLSTSTSSINRTTTTSKNATPSLQKSFLQSDNQNDVELKYSQYQKQKRTYQQQQQHNKKSSSSLWKDQDAIISSSSQACFLSYAILFTPLIIHTLSYPLRQKVHNFDSTTTQFQLPTSSSSSFIDIILDLILVLFIPHLLYKHYLNCNWWKEDDFFLSRYYSTIITPTWKQSIPIKGNTILLPIGQMIIWFLVIESLIIRYINQASCANMISNYLFHGSKDRNTILIETKSTFSILVCLNCGIVIYIISYWLENRRKKHCHFVIGSQVHTGHTGGGSRKDDKNNDLVGDLFLILNSVAGLCIGYAFTYHWYILILSMMFFLGLGVYISTRKLCFLITTMSMGLSISFYIYMTWCGHMDHVVSIIPGLIQTTLYAFNISLIVGSSVCGLMYTLAARPNCDILRKVMHYIDATGILLLLNSIFILYVGDILLHEPLHTA